jgi:putative oxidoreductase
MAATFKLIGIPATAAQIAAAGFPAPIPLAWIAAFFEVALVTAFLTGLYFRQAAIAAIAYVLFLAIAFHGPSRWASNRDEFGFFIDHFTFIAGLLFAAVHGPGTALVLRRGLKR